MDVELLLIAVPVAIGYWLLRPSSGRLPRCLVCSYPLNKWRKRKIVTCSRCQMTYHRTTVRESAPHLWQRVRKERLFSIAFRRDRRDQYLLVEYPLSETKQEANSA